MQWTCLFWNCRVYYVLLNRISTIFLLGMIQMTSKICFMLWITLFTMVCSQNHFKKSLICFCKFQVQLLCFCLHFNSSCIRFLSDVNSFIIIERGKSHQVQMQLMMLLTNLKHALFNQINIFKRLREEHFISSEK